MILAEVTASSDLHVGAVLSGLGGGLALFLYGMRKMSEALKLVAGARMKSFLRRLTTNRFTATMAGAAVTAVVQSSSVTTVLVVGFITSGLITLSQSIGIILGANIGTTITAQIIAFKVTKYALLMIAAGFVIELAGRKERHKQCGIAVMGLGLIFFGMHLMTEAVSPLRSYQPFIDLMMEMQNPLLGILIGAIFTAMVQSSSATTGIVIVMASRGLVPLESGIALLLGANIGTCITAMIAGIGRPREAVQAALAHVIFNIAGVALWIAFIPQLADAVRLFSPEFTGVDVDMRLELETPRQLANAHTLFNVGNALIFIWFTGPLAWLVQKIVPVKKRTNETDGTPKFLDDFYLKQPTVALDRAHMEIGNLGELALRMVDRSLHACVSGSVEEIDALHADEHSADQLHGAIISYLGQLTMAELIEPQPSIIYGYIAAANYFEEIADICGTRLARSGKKRRDAHVDISAATHELLLDLHTALLASGKDTIEAFASADAERAKEIVASKPHIYQLASTVQTHLIKRLVAEEPERLTVFRVETDIVEEYKRLHTLFRRIAKTVHESKAEAAAEN